MERKRILQIKELLAGTTGLEPATSCMTVQITVKARISISSVSPNIHAAVSPFSVCVCHPYIPLHSVA